MSPPTPSPATSTEPVKVETSYGTVTIVEYVRSPGLEGDPGEEVFYPMHLCAALRIIVMATVKPTLPDYLFMLASRLGVADGLNPEVPPNEQLLDAVMNRFYSMASLLQITGDKADLSNAPEEIRSMKSLLEEHFCQTLPEELRRALASAHPDYPELTAKMEHFSYWPRVVHVIRLVIGQESTYISNKPFTAAGTVTVTEFNVLDAQFWRIRRSHIPYHTSTLHPYSTWRSGGTLAPCTTVRDCHTSSIHHSHVTTKRQRIQVWYQQYWNVTTSIHLVLPSVLMPDPISTA